MTHNRIAPDPLRFSSVALAIIGSWFVRQNEVDGDESSEGRGTSLRRQREYGTRKGLKVASPSREW